MAKTEDPGLLRNADMRHESRRLFQPRLAETADHFMKISQAFAAGQGHGVELTDFPQFEQGCGVELRPGAAVAGHVFDRGATRLEGVAQHLAAAIAAKNDHALAVHIS